MATLSVEVRQGQVDPTGWHGQEVRHTYKSSVEEFVVATWGLG